MKKPRADLQRLLDEAEQAQLAEWLMAGVPYHECAELIKSQFKKDVMGPKGKSFSKFTRFWEEVCTPMMIQRRNKWADVADARMDAKQKRPGQFEEATIDAICERAMAEVENPKADIDSLRVMLGLMLKVRDQRRQQAEVELESQKYRDHVAEQKRKITDALNAGKTDKGGITPETMEKIVSELNLL